MGIFDFIPHQCVLCGKFASNVDNVGGYGIYYDSKRYFHRSCLRDITCDPTHYKHRQVDMAIQITEKLMEEKKDTIKNKEKYKENCEKLSNLCVDDKTLF